MVSFFCSPVLTMPYKHSNKAEMIFKGVGYRAVLPLKNQNVKILWLNFIPIILARLLIFIVAVFIIMRIFQIIG